MSDGRGGGGFHRRRVLRGGVRAFAGGWGRGAVGRGSVRGPDGGREDVGRGRLVAGTGNTVRGVRWDIPISGVSSVVERADARDDGGRDADCADGEQVGAARVRTSRRISRPPGRDMTVTQAVPTSKDSGRNRGDVGALSPWCDRAFAAGSQGRLRWFRVDGTRRRKVARIRAGDDRRPARRPRKMRSLGTAETTVDEPTTGPQHKSASRGHPGKSYQCPRRRPTRAAAGTPRARPVYLEADVAMPRLPSSGGRPSRGGRSGIAQSWKTSRWRLSLRRDTAPFCPRPRRSASAAGACATGITAAGTTANRRAAATTAGAFIGPPGGWRRSSSLPTRPARAADVLS